MTSCSGKRGDQACMTAFVIVTAVLFCSQHDAGGGGLIVEKSHDVIYERSLSLSGVTHQRET